MGRIGRAHIDAYLRSIGLSHAIDHTRALFALHTYNAMLLKLTAAELVTILRYDIYSGFAAQAAGCSPATLRDLLNNRVEHAEVFISNDIHNFIEGTFFSWYIENTPEPLLEAIREMLARLSVYVFPTGTHPRVRDVVKAFYQYLVPEALRRNIGEFYTPEWLVEFVLDESGYRNPSVLEKRLLDPCCGSGNFLIHAIARFKAAAEGVGLSKEETLRGILQSIIGFDLNPLAVISSRACYALWPERGTLRA